MATSSILISEARLRSARNKATAAAVLAAALALSGCADYLAHRDTVTLGLGDANDANIGIQTIDPFPPPAYQTKIYTDGRRVARAQRLYVTGAPVAAPQQQSPTSGGTTVTTTSN